MSTTISLGYQKPNNTKLFSTISTKDPELDFHNTQNYVPIYSKIFNMNSTNANAITLDQKWTIKDVVDCVEYPFLAKVYSQTSATKKTVDYTDKEVFIKTIPLVDPYRYLCGKYEKVENILSLPVWSESEQNTKYAASPYNSAYVECLFVYLTSKLLNDHNFHNGLNFFGSFLGMKHNFTYDVLDDIDFLASNAFFVKNNGSLFVVDPYEHLLEKPQPQKALIYTDDDTVASQFLPIDADPIEGVEIIADDSQPFVSLDDLQVYNLDVDSFDIVHSPNALQPLHTPNASESETSECSSRISYTISNKSKSESSHNSHDSNNDDQSRSNCTDDDIYVNVTFDKYPVQIMFMEFCDYTFLDFVRDKNTTDDEIIAALMQVILTLIVYQYIFGLTHNDLHTENVMWTETDIQFLYFCINGVHYKVPTYGKIFKIIDFDRSIYTINGKRICTESFAKGNDGYMQYNTEPFYEPDRERIDPNPSFDLCRFACCLFDNIIMPEDDLANLTSPLKRLINEWCLDDSGLHMMYKKDGDERYPGFKLYRMIAKHVHNHVPMAQLARPEFAKFAVSKSSIKNKKQIFDLGKFAKA